VRHSKLDRSTSGLGHFRSSRPPACKARYVGSASNSDEILCGVANGGQVPMNHRQRYGTNTMPERDIVQSSARLEPNCPQTMSK
jgi:hypothetical protein